VFDDRFEELALPSRCLDYGKAQLNRLFRIYGKAVLGVLLD
jgi:hypothetical protein